MWAQLRRQGVEVARCTVEWLIRANGWCGATRAMKVRTTVFDPAATRAPDLSNRQFAVKAPNTLLVADFAYVQCPGGRRSQICRYHWLETIPVPIAHLM
jgi:putative transposase